MAKISSIFDGPSIEEEASRWLVRLDANDVTTETRAAFEHWLSGHPRRRRIFRRLERSWHRLDELGVLCPSSAGGNPDPDLTRRFIGPAGRWTTARAIAFASLAASFLVAVIGWAVFMAGDGIQVYETAVGERLTVSLPDSSIVELNTNSVLEVAFTEDERRVRLMRGEGHFEIAHAPDRPFVVATETGTVRALGTAFNVRLHAHTIEVMVTEGLVEIAPSGPHPAPEPAGAVGEEDSSGPAIPLALAVGQQAHVDATGAAVVDVDLETMERKLAWRRGMLIFNGETLEVVIAEISRYTHKRIVFADDDLRHLEVGGYFRADDVDGVLNMIATAFPIDVRRAGGDVIYLADASPADRGQ